MRKRGAKVGEREREKKEESRVLGHFGVTFGNLGVFYNFALTSAGCAS